MEQRRGRRPKSHSHDQRREELEENLSVHKGQDPDTVSAQVEQDPEAWADKGAMDVGGGFDFTRMGLEGGTAQVGSGG